MAGTTSCKISVFPAPLCFRGFSNGVHFGGKEVTVHQRGTLLRTNLTPRLKLSKVPRLVITSSTKSKKPSKSFPKFNGLEIIKSKIFIKNKGTQLVKEPTQSDSHLLEGPIQAEILEQLELEHSLADKYMPEDVAEDQKIHTSAKKRSLHSIMSARFCDAIEKALIRAIYGSSKPTNYYLLGNYAPVDEFGPQSVTSIRGYLPECLNGGFVRVGPNPKYQPVAKYHWFDGDGYVVKATIVDVLRKFGLPSIVLLKVYFNKRDRIMSAH